LLFRRNTLTINKCPFELRRRVAAFMRYDVSDYLHALKHLNIHRLQTIEWLSAREIDRRSFLSLMQRKPINVGSVPADDAMRNAVVRYLHQAFGS
jgi:hypothetical protein